MDEFKEHFERVSRERYEENPRVVERVNDLRIDGRARRANEMLNVLPERMEIERAMNEMRDSSPRKDGVRLREKVAECQLCGIRPEELQGVGPRGWTKALTGPEWSERKKGQGAGGGGW